MTNVMNGTDVTLDLWRQPLDAVPPEVWERTELTVLILADTGITELPPEIVRLTRLRTLDLGHNRLAGVPAALAGLALLRRLDLRGNRIADLPDWLADPAALPGLERLHLRWNEVRPSARLLDALAARGCVTLF